MSKSIWHRYDEAPKHQDIVMTDTGCWAYRADLLALETELERTRKALEIQQEFITKLYLNGNITDEQLERTKRLIITALEQKDVK